MPSPCSALVPMTGTIQVGQGALCVGAIALADDVDVGDFEDAGLDRLDLVTQAGRRYDDGAMRGARDLDFVLADTDGFNHDWIETGKIQYVGAGECARGQSARHAARRHAANEDVGIERMRAHAHTVAEDRATRIGTRWIDRDHTHAHAARAQDMHQFTDQGRLATARYAGDTDQVSVPGATICGGERRAHFGQAGLGAR